MTPNASIRAKLRPVLFAVGLSAHLLACSAGGGAPSGGVDGSGATQGAGGRAVAGGTGGTGGDSLVVGSGGASSKGSARLEAQIERDGLRVEVVILGCTGACADVVAVARNGAPPYSFAWEDGSTTAERRLCPSASGVFAVDVTDSGVRGTEFPRPPVTVTAQLTANVFDCEPVDGGAPSPDAGPGPACESGDLVRGDPLAGTTTYFRQGAPISAGRYRVAYADGCMSYGLGWTIHNIIPPGWLLAGTFTALPGISGAGYADFEDCVAANRAVPPIEVDHPGGQMGVWNNDYPRTDNRAGIDGRDPTWCLTALPSP